MDPQESYREYRQRQRRGENNNAADGEAVWDDEVEEAFFEGNNHNHNVSPADACVAMLQIC